MRLYGTAALAFALMAQASATLTFFNSRVALGATDLIDWNQIGPDLTTVPGSYLGLTNNGVQFLATVGPDAYLLHEAGSWNGTFTPGDAVLFSGYEPGSIVIRFANSQSSVGADLSSNLYGDYTGTISVYNNIDQFLGSYNVDSNMHGGSDSTAPFLGVFSDTNDIGSVVFTTTNDSVGLAITNVSTGPCNPVPEPASIAVLGLGVVSVLRRRRKV